MKKICLSFVLLILLLCKSFAQELVVNKKSHFYVGVDIKVATLFTSTSIKSLFGIKLGYNQKLSNGLFTGPQAEALFIRSPINKVARISLFAGPAAEFELKPMQERALQQKTTSVTVKSSWVFPLNPKSSDYTFLDCISVGASILNDDFLGFNQSSVGINLDWQRYDIGFYDSSNRMLNINTVSSTRL